MQTRQREELEAMQAIASPTAGWGMLYTGVTLALSTHGEHYLGVHYLVKSDLLPGVAEIEILVPSGEGMESGSLPWVCLVQDTSLYAWMDC